MVFVVRSLMDSIMHIYHFPQPTLFPRVSETRETELGHVPFFFHFLPHFPTPIAICSNADESSFGFQRRYESLYLPFAQRKSFS